MPTYSKDCMARPSRAEKRGSHSTSTSNNMQCAPCCAIWAASKGSWDLIQATAGHGQLQIQLRRKIARVSMAGQIVRARSSMYQPWMQRTSSQQLNDLARGVHSPRRCPLHPRAQIGGRQDQRLTPVHDTSMSPSNALSGQVTVAAHFPGCSLTFCGVRTLKCSVLKVLNEPLSQI
jgi:hypothetical protein